MRRFRVVLPLAGWILLLVIMLSSVSLTLVPLTIALIASPILWMDVPVLPPVDTEYELDSRARPPRCNCGCGYEDDFPEADEITCSSPWRGDEGNMPVRGERLVSMPQKRRRPTQGEVLARVPDLRENAQGPRLADLPYKRRRWGR